MICVPLDSLEDTHTSGELRVFSHMLYEIEKGIRPLALFTLSSPCAIAATNKLSTRHIEWYVQSVPDSDRKNLFFGASSCIKLIKRVLKGRSLADLTPEEDFILGALLGYDLTRQCDRFNLLRSQS